MTTPSWVPDHAIDIANAVKPFGAMVATSPGTPHATVVHAEGQATVIDTIIAANGLRGERIDATRVKVFPA